jgi:uncharacterized protein YecT (DUF1311 family)
MAYCRYCSKEIHETAIRCPHCGAEQSLSDAKKGTVFLAIASLIIGIINLLAAIGMPKNGSESEIINFIIFSVCLSILGLTLGTISLWKRYPAMGSATGGVVLSVLALFVLYGNWAILKNPDYAKTSPEAPVKSTQPTPSVSVTITQPATTQQLSENSSWAPSFDCSKVSTGPERLICTNQELGKADIELAQIYTEFMNIAANKDRVKRDQIYWLKHTRDACSTASCMLEAYKIRSLLLQQEITATLENDETGK